MYSLVLLESKGEGRACTTLDLETGARHVLVTLESDSDITPLLDSARARLFCLPQHARHEDSWCVIDLNSGERQTLPWPSELMGYINEPVLSEDGHTIAFEYRAEGQPVQIGCMVEIESDEWSVQAIYSGDGYSVVKPGLSSDGGILVCYAERGTGGFEFAFVSLDDDVGQGRLRRIETQGTAMPTIALSIDSQNQVAMVPIRAAKPQKNGLGMYSFSSRQWNVERHLLPGSIELIPPTHVKTQYVVLADRVISIRPDGQVSIPLPDGHKRTCSILTTESGSGCYLAGRLSGGIGYCQWDFDNPEHIRAWRVDGVSDSMVLGSIKTSLINEKSFSLSEMATFLAYRTSGAHVGQARSKKESVERLKTAPTPQVGKTGPLEMDSDDPFGSAADLTETEMGREETGPLSDQTTGSIFKTGEPTGSMEGIQAGQDSSEMSMTAILPAPPDGRSEDKTARLGSLDRRDQLPSGGGEFGYQSEETVEVGAVDFDASSPTQNEVTSSADAVEVPRTDKVQVAQKRDDDPTFALDADASQREGAAEPAQQTYSSPSSMVSRSYDPVDAGHTDSDASSKATAVENAQEAGGLDDPSAKDLAAQFEREEGSETEDVWTSAPQPMGGVTEHVIRPLSIPKRNATDILDFSVFQGRGNQGTASVEPPAMPNRDFEAWFSWVLMRPDPLQEIQGVRAFRGDGNLNAALEDVLKNRWDILSRDPDGETELSLLIIACAHAEAQATRPHFMQVCEDAYRRIGREKSVPTFIEHLAMAVVRTMVGPGRFSAMAVAKEYDVVVARIREAVEKGPKAGRKRLRQFSRKYDGALATLLGKEKIELPRKKTGSDDPSAASPSGDIMDGYEFPELGSGEDNEEGERPSSHEPALAASTQSQTAAPPVSIDIFSVSDNADESEPTIDFGQPNVGVPRWLIIFLGVLAVLFGLLTAGLSSETGLVGPAIGLFWALGGFAFIGGSRGGLWIGKLAYLTAGLSLILYGWQGSPPAWLLPSGLIALGAVAVVLGSILPLCLVALSSRNRQA